MKFEERYFKKQKYTETQIQQFYSNALKDLDIAIKDTFISVKFTYAYTAFLKAGIALLASYHVRARSMPGHHVKIIEKMGEILQDEDVVTLGNHMRAKRNLDLYDIGIELTRKECKEYMDIAQKTVARIAKILSLKP